LSDAFLTAWKGPAAADGLEARLAAICARGRAAWPGVALEDERFCRHLAERAPVELPPDAALERLRVEDLYLACGCLQRLPAALREFDERLLSRTRQHLARLRPDDQLVDETRQALRTRLFVSANDAPARIAQYSGLGPLESWVRVAAVRVALNLIAAQERHAPSEPLDEDLLAGSADPELDYLRERYRATFAAALKRAIAELPPGERALLRFHFVDGLTPGHIGEIYGVHRTTTMRRIAAAGEQLLALTRAHVMKELDVSPSECDGLVELVRSRMSLTLTSLFRSRAR
jgi:RNA polymerase sigma-70 factor (ECF subfamily)